MTVQWIDLEAAYFAVKDDPLTRAWIHRGTSEIRLVFDQFDADQHPPAGDRNWVEIPTPDDLHLKRELAESFVHQHCPELTDSAARCFSKSHPWRHYRDLLDMKGYLDEWRGFENDAIQVALAHWANKFSIPVALS